MRISIIGPGEYKEHYKDILKIPEKEIEFELEKISEALSVADEICLLPDRGVSIEIARRYKELCKGKVIGIIPESDQEIGVEFLKKYCSEEADGGKLFDSLIDSGNWYKHDLIKALFGNAVLYLGRSPGTDLERNGAEYMFQLIKGSKKNIDLAKRKVHPELKADRDFCIIYYSKFFSTEKFLPEEEYYLKEFGIKVYYAKDSDELKEVIKKIS